LKEVIATLERCLVIAALVLDIGGRVENWEDARSKVSALYKFFKVRPEDMPLKLFLVDNALFIGYICCIGE